MRAGIPEPSIQNPYAQLQYIFECVKCEKNEIYQRSFSHACKVYIDFLEQTKAYYDELENDYRFFIRIYWEVDALIRFHGWLSTSKLASKTVYGIMKCVRHVMNYAYQVGEIDAEVYWPAIDKGHVETKERASYSDVEMEIIAQSLDTWLQLAMSVNNGYVPSGLGIPYKEIKKRNSSFVVVDSEKYSVQKAAKKFGISASSIRRNMEKYTSGRVIVGLDEPDSESGIPLVVQGIEYRNIADAAKAHNLNPNKVSNRLRNDWSIEEAFEICDRKPVGKEIEVNGIRYSSYSEAAKAHNQIPRVFSKRINDGFTPEQAAGLKGACYKKNLKNKEVGFSEENMPSDNEKSNVNTDFIVKGTVYKSLRDACCILSRDYRLVYQRLYNGWTTDEAFDYVPRPSNSESFYINGVKYLCVNEAAKVYKVDRRVIARRLKDGWTPEQAVNLEPRYVSPNDERAILWEFENKYFCDPGKMFEDYDSKSIHGVTSKQLLKYFRKWGVWPHIDRRLIMPLAALLALYTGLNPESLKDLRLNSYIQSHPLTGQPCIRYRKQRGSSHSVSAEKELHTFLLDPNYENCFINENAEKVHRIIELVISLTSKVRIHAPSEVSDRLFIFNNYSRNSGKCKPSVVAINWAKEAGAWSDMFCTDEGLYEIFGNDFMFNIARFRTTFATNMVIAGAGLYQVKVVLGHQDMQTTENYLDSHRISPEFNKVVSRALSDIVKQCTNSNSDSNIIASSNSEYIIYGFHETLSGIGCKNPYNPGDSVRKATGHTEGSVCKNWNMCLFCERSIITVNSLPKLISYREKIANALENGNISVLIKSDLFRKTIELIDGILVPDSVFPESAINRAFELAAELDDILLDQLVWQGF